MYNCNPETVSTDYDTADRLYFEPLDPGACAECNRPGTAHGRDRAVWRTDPAEPCGGSRSGGREDSWEHRRTPSNFQKTVSSLRNCWTNWISPSLKMGLPVHWKKPAKWLAGSAIRFWSGPPLCWAGGPWPWWKAKNIWQGFIKKAIEAAPGQPILIDKFMEDAFEIDVDALADGKRVVIGAVMQHIEEAGVHSGDAACVLPPYKVSAYHQDIMREYTEQLGLALGVRGLMNVQFALKDEVVCVLEVNPRASRTVPYASKATGLNLAYARRAGDGRRKSLEELGVTEEPRVDGFFVKEAVLPFKKLPGSSMFAWPGNALHRRGDGTCGSRFGHAFAKSQIAAGMGLPQAGAVLISVNDYDKSAGLKIARDLHRMGFQSVCHAGTAEFFCRTGLPVITVNKVPQGSPHVVDLIRAGKVQLILNTPLGPRAHSDGAQIRAAATLMNVPLLTTLSAGMAAVNAIQALRQKDLKYRSLQVHFNKNK